MIEAFLKPLAGTQVLSYVCYACVATIALFTLLRRLISSQSSGRPNGKPVPRAPWVIPYWDHMKPFIVGREALAKVLVPLRGRCGPFRFLMPGASIFVFTGAKYVREVLTSEHSFSAGISRIQYIRNVLDLSKPAIDGIVAGAGPRDSVDGKRTKATPYEGILWTQYKLTYDSLKQSGLNTAMNALMRQIGTSLNKTAPGNERHYVPDMFTFFRLLFLEGVVSTLFGADFYQMNPEFEQAYSTFDENIHFIYTGLPHWICAKGFAARDKCFEAVERWRETTLAQNLNAEDAETTEENWGSQYMVLRKKMYDEFPEFSAHDRDRADFGFTWAASTNLAPSTSWALIELLRHPEARKRAMDEAQKARLPAQPGDTLPRFDVGLLVQQPYLQAFAHEILRLKATQTIARDTMRDHNMDSYTINKGSVAIVNISNEHLDKTRWENRPNARPVEEFAPERFLTTDPETGEERFSLTGLEGTFVPFGMGRTMCPGRHLAVRFPIIAAATLLAGFDFENVDEKAWASEQKDFSTFGWSSVYPAMALPGYIQRRPLN